MVFNTFAANLSLGAIPW